MGGWRVNALIKYGFKITVNALVKYGFKITVRNEMFRSGATYKTKSCVLIDVFVNYLKSNVKQLEFFLFKLIFILKVMENKYILKPPPSKPTKVWKFTLRVGIFTQCNYMYPWFFILGWPTEHTAIWRTQWGYGFWYHANLLAQTSRCQHRGARAGGCTEWVRLGSAFYQW